MKTLLFNLPCKSLIYTSLKLTVFLFNLNQLVTDVCQI